MFWLLENHFFELISSRRVEWQPFLYIIKKKIFAFFWSKNQSPFCPIKVKNTFGYHSTRLDEISSKKWFFYNQNMNIYEKKLNGTWGFLIDILLTFKVIFKFLPGLSKPIYQKLVFLMKRAPNLDPESDSNRFIRENKI